MQNRVAHQRKINNSRHEFHAYRYHPLPGKRIGIEGFTLMELLVAMSLLGLVFAVVFQAFSLGIRAWEKGEAIQEEYQRLRAALSLIVDQISSAYPVTVRDKIGGESYLAFEGKENSLEFITSLSLSPRFKGGLSFAAYFLKDDYTTDTKTFMASEGTMLTKGFFAEAQRTKTRDQGTFELITGITELKFAYYGNDSKDSGQGWKEEWDGKKQGRLPQAIKISLKINHNQADFPDTIIVPIKASSGAERMAGTVPEGPFQGRRRTSVFPPESPEEPESPE